MVTEWPTTQLVLNALGINTVSLPPWRVSRGDGTACLTTIQASKHQLFVIDVPPIRRWDSKSRDIFWNLMRMWVNESRKTSTKVLLLGPRSSEWNEPSLRSLIDEHGLHRAEHRWCAFGMSVEPTLRPNTRSNHAYVTATSWHQRSHDCTCEAEITHVQDKPRQEFSRSQRSEVYQAFVTRLLAILAESGSLRPPDSQSNCPDHGQGTNPLGAE